jgi:RHS repeat-associated protein
MDSREWTPFGVEVGTAQEGLGYAGEWYGSSAELLYLRARWYEPHTGRFFSPDPIIPDLRRPQSVNRYAYALGNPVRFSDRTGLFPTEDQICDDGDTEYRCSEFTCNCGWIDWNHLRTSDRLGYGLLDDLAYAVDSYWPEPTLRDSWGIYVGIPLGFAGFEMDLFGGYAVIPHRQVPIGSEDGTTLATSIFMDANERFEELQGAHSWLPFVGGKLKSSYYSEEDLPSDIIGFYAGYQRFVSGLGYEQVYQQVRELCVSVGKQASVNVFRETYKNGALAQTNWRNWHPRFIPLAGCNSHVCKGTRTWPSNFAVLTSARMYPGVNGDWWWFRNMSEDGSLVSTERPRVYRLLKDLRVPTPPPYAP